LERRAEQIRAESRAEAVSAIRTYEPSDQVMARLEIAAPGRLRGRDAGVDVRGDGSLVPYRGGVFRRELEPREGQSPYETIREALQA
jgi:hypothetical protein